MNNLDNKYIISEFLAIDPDVQNIKEAIEKNQPIIVPCILQKANTLNRNGRVYPFDILKREVDKYQELVKERSAMGECVPAGTEILTKNGWKDIKDISKDEEIYTLNLDNNNIEIQKTTDKIERKYNDDLVHIYNAKNLDMLVTKNHKVIIWDRNNKPKIVLAKDIYDKINLNNSLHHFHIKGSEEWTGEYIDDIKLIDKEIEIGGNLQLVQEKIKTKRLIDYTDSNSIYIIQQKTTDKGSYLDNRFVKTELIPFNDYVYCVSVPNKTWLMKYNGKINWTHNCDHPDSAVISLANVSHIVTEMWWKGETLHGKIQIADTPAGDTVKGLLKTGIKLGISSRGVGSVKKNKEGQDVVQEDFELIGFDIVSSPSTPGAYLFKESKQWGMKKLIDSDQKILKTDDVKIKIKNLKNSLNNLSKDGFWN
jgi:hypothetical protein